MTKRPDHMTPDERLTRILSLERQLRAAQLRAEWAERDAEGTRSWALKAFEENRRLVDWLGELIERIPWLIEPERQAALADGQAGGDSDAAD